MTLQQSVLFDMTEPWKKNWGGMPEYTHEDLEPARSLLVYFESDVDVEKFAALLEQSVGPNVRSIWFPEAEIGRFSDKKYCDE